VTGYFAYHAVPNNIQALSAFRRGIRWLWGRSLRRRSQNDRTTRTAINRLVAQWLPKPRITHPWPEQRFAVTHPEVGAGCPNWARPVLCGGCAVVRIPTATSTHHARPADTPEPPRFFDKL